MNATFPREMPGRCLLLGTFALRDDYPICYECTALKSKKGQNMYRTAISLLAAAGLGLGLVQAASAADLPRGPVYKAPAMMAPVYSWTGLYIGGNVGGSFGEAKTDVTFAGFPLGSTKTNPTGVIGGGQIGYNWQIAPTWLLGVETDFQGSSQSDSATLLAGLGVTNKLDWFGTVRGRLGYTGFADRWMIYATGGLAYAHTKTDGLVFGVPFTGEDTRTGWTVGAGIEAATWLPNWTWKVEYLYMDLGKTTVTDPTGFLNLSSRYTDNIVRFGINYKFGGSNY
jgi:outer membrane immunogenic protein